MDGNVKHTPGPWEVEVCLTGYAINSASKKLERLCITRATPNEDYANARLISAAPELLEACKQAVIIYERDCTDCPDTCKNCDAWLVKELLYATIAKAEGGE